MSGYTFGNHLAVLGPVGLGGNYNTSFAGQNILGQQSIFGQGYGMGMGGAGMMSFGGMGMGMGGAGMMPFMGMNMPYIPYGTKPEEAREIIKGQMENTKEYAKLNMQNTKDLMLLNNQLYGVANQTNISDSALKKKSETIAHLMASGRNRQAADEFKNFVNVEIANDLRFKDYDDVSKRRAVALDIYNKATGTNLLTAIQQTPSEPVQGVKMGLGGVWASPKGSAYLTSDVTGVPVSTGAQAALWGTAGLTNAALWGASLKVNSLNKDIPVGNNNGLVEKANGILNNNETTNKKALLEEALGGKKLSVSDKEKLLAKAGKNADLERIINGCSSTKKPFWGIAGKTGKVGMALAALGTAKIGYELVFGNNTNSMVLE